MDEAASVLVPVSAAARGAKVWLTAGGEASPARGESCHWHKMQQRGRRHMPRPFLGYSSLHGMNENRLHLLFLVRRN